MPASEYFHFVPGQYLDIMLPQNRRRSFPIASTPGDGKMLELHIRRVSSGEFTQQLFDGTLEKSLLRIEGPLGQFLVSSRVAATGTAGGWRHWLRAVALDAAQSARGG